MEIALSYRKTTGPGGRGAGPGAVCTRLSDNLLSASTKSHDVTGSELGGKTRIQLEFAPSSNPSLQHLTMVKGSDILLIIVAIIFPPAAAAFITGCSSDLAISVALTILVSTAQTSAKNGADYPGIPPVST